MLNINQKIEQTMSIKNESYNDLNNKINDMLKLSQETLFKNLEKFDNTNTDQFNNNLYFLLMSHSDFLCNNTTEEISREKLILERINESESNDLIPDSNFWIILNPQFTKHPQFIKKFMICDYFLEEQDNILNISNKLNFNKRNYDNFFVQNDKNIYLNGNLIKKISEFEFEIYTIAILSYNEKYIDWLKLRIGDFEPISKYGQAYIRPTKINGISDEIKFNDLYFKDSLSSIKEYNLNPNFITQENLDIALAFINY